MLYLNPPYRVINNYTLLPDHEDPSLFYVLPPAPTLGRTNEGHPDISLLQYLGGGSGEEKIAGGLLTFSTELNISDDKLLELQAYINSNSNGTVQGGIRLLPVLFDRGSVELVVLGEKSNNGNENQPSSRSGPLDIKILGEGKPSLDGKNRAVFQLVLEPYAAELMEQSLDLPDLPVIVIYRMNFTGLRPNFNLDIRADWKKVYHSLKQKAKTNFYYVATDAEILINEALEENNIEINTNVFGTGEEARAAAEKARKQLIEWIFEHLFKPVIDPKSATANTIGSTIDKTVWSLTRSLLPGVGYRLEVLNEEQLRFLSARMNENIAERKEIIPQGTLGGFLNSYRLDKQGNPNQDWAEIRKKIIQKVNLNSFPRLEVKLGVENRFESDGISSVLVETARLNPDGGLTDTQTFMFRSEKERENYVVNLLGEDNSGFSSPYQYRLTVKFNPSGLYGPHEAVSSQWLSANTTELFVEPRQIYTIRQIEVGVTPTFSFSQFPSVTVELRYKDEGDDYYQTGRLILTPETSRRVWSFRSFEPGPYSYEYRITYHRSSVEGGSIESTWREQIVDCLSISDPLPKKRRLNLFVNLPWEEIITAFIRVKYEDNSNNIEYDEQINLKMDTRYIRKDYPIVEDGPLTIQYRLTMLLKTGELLEGSWRQTDDDRIIIDRRLVDRKTVTLRTIGGDLAENKIATIRLNIQVQEPETGQIKEEKEILINQDNFKESYFWEYLLGDPPIHKIYYRATFIDVNGFSRNCSWKSTESDLLVINLRTRTVNG